jgi:hypothetical protein
MSYDGLIPVPPHLWHLTILSPFFSVPFPSQFLQGFFLSWLLLRTISSRSIAALFIGSQMAYVPRYGAVHSAMPDEIRELLKKGFIGPY